MKKSKDISEWYLSTIQYNENALGNKRENDNEDEISSTHIFRYRWVAKISPYTTAIQDVKDTLLGGDYMRCLKAETEQQIPMAILLEDGEKIKRRKAVFNSMIIPPTAQKKLDDFMAIEDEFDENGNWIPAIPSTSEDQSPHFEA